jgi:hypothetical protein
MKTALSFLCGSLLLAAPVVEGQFAYTTNNGAITVTSYAGSGGVVTISNFVSSIGRSAFEQNSLANILGSSGKCVPGFMEPKKL